MYYLSVLTAKVIKMVPNIKILCLEPLLLHSDYYTPATPLKTFIKNFLLKLSVIYLSIRNNYWSQISSID